MNVEAPIPNYFLTPEKPESFSLVEEKVYQFLFQNEPKEIILSKSSDNSHIFIRHLPSISSCIPHFMYEIKFSYDDLKTIDKIFRTCDDLNEAFELFQQILEGKENIIKDINDNNITLIIKIFGQGGSFHESKIQLIKVEMNEKEILKNICEEIGKLKELREENKNIRNELNKVKEENIKLRNDVNFLLNWKEEITNQKQIENLTQNKNLISNQKQIQNLNENKNLISIQNTNLDIDSKIITSKDELNLIESRIRKNKTILANKSFKAKLLYRASRDGDEASKFHELCDSSKNTIVLVETKDNLKFGGYTEETWKGEIGKGDKDDKEAFCFSLNEFKIYNSIRQPSIWTNPNNGPSFQNSIFNINNKCFTNGGYCSESSHSFYDNQKYPNEINNGKDTFEVKEVEVFQSIFQ